MAATTQVDSRCVLSVKGLCDKHPDFTLGMVRWWLFHRDENGLARAVRKVGRRLFIDEQDFFNWLDEHQEESG